RRHHRQIAADAGAGWLVSRAEERAPPIKWLRGRLSASDKRASVERKILAAAMIAGSRTRSGTARVTARDDAADTSPVGDAPPDIPFELDAAIEALKAGDVAGALETLQSLRAAVGKTPDATAEPGEEIPGQQALEAE